MLNVSIYTDYIIITTYVKLKLKLKTIENVKLLIFKLQKNKIKSIMMKHMVMLKNNGNFKILDSSSHRINILLCTFCVFKIK